MQLKMTVLVRACSATARKKSVWGCKTECCLRDTCGPLLDGIHVQRNQLAAQIVMGQAVHGCVYFAAAHIVPVEQDLAVQIPAMRGINRVTRA